MRKISVILLFCILFCLTGCNKQGDGGEASLNMPEIVFMNTIDYNNGKGVSALTFYDRNGNHYISADEAVCRMSYRELVNEYAAGKLESKIELHTSCDVNELYANYKKLCEAVADGEYAIEDPEVLPDVEANICNWYGFYYDKDGELKRLCIHKEERLTHLYSENEQVNEIYEWYIGSFKD